MAKFTTRILLENGTESDYEQLHTAMERAGFSRFIKSDDGRKFRMPWAEYNFDGSASLDQVLETANLAATSTGNQFSVLVTEAVARQWLNLREVRV